MDKGTSKNLREELHETFSDAYIENAGLLIHNLAEVYYNMNNLAGKVYFNDNIFEYCLIDILIDLARLKHFHDIDFVNYEKLMAYTASWCLKRKPFQLIEGCDEKYLYVNEEFALTLLLQASKCCDKSAKYVKESEDDLVEAFQQMRYHLKYRNTNPQTLELFLVGMETGKKIYSVIA